MTNAFHVPLLAVFLLAIVAGASAAPPTDEVKRFAETMVQSTASGNVDAIAALYGPAAVMLPPDGTAIGGRDAIKAAFAANQAAGTNEIRFTSVQVQGDDLQATVVWQWILTITPSGKAAVKTSGRSMLYMQHLPAGWQIAIDMFQAGPAR